MLEMNSHPPCSYSRALTLDHGGRQNFIFLHKPMFFDVYSDDEYYKAFWNVDSRVNLKGVTVCFQFYQGSKVKNEYFIYKCDGKGGVGRKDDTKVEIISEINGRIKRVWWCQGLEWMKKYERSMNVDDDVPGLRFVCYVALHFSA